MDITFWTDIWTYRENYWYKYCVIISCIYDYLMQEFEIEAYYRDEPCPSPLDSLTELQLPNFTIATARGALEGVQSSWSTLPTYNQV